jgi:uncharacterized protein YifE (UPF0438 family)
MSLIDDLMRDQSIDRCDLEGHSYAIRVLGRGEMLFFQEDEKALICEIDAANSAIISKSVKNWDKMKKMSDEEQKRVITVMADMYRKYINENVVIV